MYMGTMNTTVNGRTCREWASTTAHAHTSYPDGSRVAARNYCRNPTSHSDGVWCYTTDPSKNWELCPVPLCNTRDGKYKYLIVCRVDCRM